MKSRDLLKTAAERLAHAVLDSPGHSNELYQLATEVNRLTAATQGRKPPMAHDKTWELCEYIEARVVSGESVTAAAKAASEERRFPISARTAADLFRSWPGPARKI